MTINITQDNFNKQVNESYASYTSRTQNNIKELHEKLTSIYMKYYPNEKKSLYYVKKYIKKIDKLRLICSKEQYKKAHQANEIYETSLYLALNIGKNIVIFPRII